MPRTRKKPAQPQEVGASNDPRRGIIQGRMHWTNTRELPVLFANHMWAQLIENQFLITFGHVELPYELISEEMAKRVAKDGIEVKAVCRLAIGPDQVEKIVGALTQILEGYREHQKVIGKQ